MKLHVKHKDPNKTFIGGIVIGFIIGGLIGWAVCGTWALSMLERGQTEIQIRGIAEDDITIN
jgi:uncharacterized protein YcfJ